MNIENIEFEVLADGIDELELIKILNDKNIYTLEDLKGEYMTCSECDKCENKGHHITRLSNEFKFDESTETLVKCEDDDENVIDDFIIYVCGKCEKVSYYLQIN